MAKCFFSMFLIFITSFSAKCEDPLLKELESQLKRALAKPISRIRLPLIARSSVSVTAHRTNADVTPFGMEYYCDEGRDRLIRTGPSSVFSRKDGSTPKGSQVTTKVSQAKVIEVSGVLADSAALFSRNPRYVFQLDTSRTSGGWLLTNIGKTGGSSIKDLEKIFAEPREQFQQPINWIQGLDGPLLPVDKLFQVEGFKLLSATQTKPDGPIIVKFQRLYRGAPPSATMVIDCTYTFDPANDWLPTEWTEKVPFQKDTITTTFKQKVAMSEGRYVADITITRSSEVDKRIENSKCKVTVETVDRLPEGECTLAAYGIPEPSEFALRSPPLYIWLLGIAGMLLILMIVLRILAYRKAKAG